MPNSETVHPCDIERGLTSVDLHWERYTELRRNSGCDVVH